MALLENQGVTKVSRIHSLGNINVCTVCHDNSFKGCSHMSVWTKVMDQHFGLQKIRVSQRPSRFTLFMQIKYPHGDFSLHRQS